MWFIFIHSTVAFALIASVVVWIIHRVINSMIREDKKLEKELKEIDKEKE